MTDTDELDATIRDALGLSDGADLASLTYETSPEWDSVGHLQLVLAIEERFGISIESTDVVSMTTYEKLRRTITGKYGVEPRTGVGVPGSEGDATS
jgi:acyl carrier protein